MLPQKMIDDQLAQQERKLRYLLGKRDDPWLGRNKDKLQNLLDLFADLAKEGLNQEDLFDQFMYTNDMIKYAEVKEVMLNEYRNTENDSNPAILSFEHSMYNQMQLHREKIKTEIDKDYTTNITSSGLIRLTTQPNKMFALKNSVLLDTRNEDVSIKIAIDEMKYYYSVQIGENVYPMVFDFDKIIGLQKTNTLPNYHDHYLQYDLNGESYELRFYTVNIDINEKIVDITLQDGKVSITPTDMEKLFLNIPLSTAIYMQAFKTTGQDPFECFKTSLIRIQLETVNDQIIRSFNDKYAKDISYGLYGQGAMIGVSQVYELAKTAVRAVKTEYSVKTSPSMEMLRMPEYFPPFNDKIDQTTKNKIDIIGNTIMPDKGAFVSKNTWQIRIQRPELPGMINYQEVAGQVSSGYNIAQARVTVTKGEMDRFLSDGTISSAKYWIENVTTINSVSNALPVYKARTSKGNCDVTFDACVEVPEYRYKVHGVRVNLISSGLTDSETVTVINGYQVTTIAAATLRMIIWPDDLATEGSSSTSITVSYTVRGSPKTVTAVAVKQVIQYGDTQINAYVVNLENSHGQYRYIVGTGFDVKIEKTLVEQYTSRDENGFGTNLSITTTLKAPKITSTYEIANNRTSLINSNNEVSGRGMRPSQNQLPRAITTYQSSDVKWITCQNAPWSMPAPEVDAVGWINFNSPITCENGVDWTDIVMERSFSGYDDFGLQDDVPYLTYYLTDGPHTSNWSLLKTSWNGSFPVISKGNYMTISDISNINANFTLTDIVMNLEEVVLPAGVLNQGVIVESIVNLQRAVEYLQNYASYLTYLIENLDARLTQVEETLKQVVDILTTMINGKKGILGIISDVVGFIGTGVGMFFPLIGLGITIIGQVLKGADEINEGDIVTGSMDIVTGGIMAALGIRKWNQRLKRKYGATETIPTPNDGLPTYEEAMSMPGYGCISVKRDIDPFSYGAARNVWYDFSGDVLVIHGDVYPNSNLNITAPNSLTAFKITGAETWTKSQTLRADVYVRTNVEFTANLLGFSDNGLITSSTVTDVDLVFLLGIDTTVDEYTLILYLYGTGSIEPFSKETSFDPENLDTLMVANGIIISGNTRSIKPTAAPRCKAGKKKQRSWILKYKNGHKARSDDSKQKVSPLLPISTLFTATNPIIQSTTSQETLFQNLYHAVIPYIGMNSGV